MQARLAALPAQAWDPDYQAATNAAMTGRRGNMERFKPGVDAIVVGCAPQACRAIVPQRGRIMCTMPLRRPAG